MVHSFLFFLLLPSAVDLDPDVCSEVSELSNGARFNTCVVTAPRDQILPVPIALEDLRPFTHSNPDSQSTKLVRSRSW